MHTIHPFEFRYPSGWSGTIHRDHVVLERDTVRWLEGLGLVRSRAERHALERMRPGGYGGFPFPVGPFDRLATVTRFLTLWILHDDELEGEHALPVDRLAALVRGQPERFDGGSSFELGWWELGRRFAAVMSEDWLQRLSTRFADWVRSVDDEAAQVDALRRTGRQPSVEAFLAQRRRSIGVRPTLGFVEHMQQRELDPAVFSDPDFVAFEHAATMAVTCINEIGGVAKDFGEGWINLVLALAQERRTSIAEAMDLAMQLHDRSVAELERLGRGLSLRYGGAMACWVAGVQTMVAGFARWHTEAPRYAERLVAPSLGLAEPA